MLLIPTQDRKVTQDRQFKGYEVILMNLLNIKVSHQEHGLAGKAYPILCSLSNEGTLVASSTRISLDRMPTSTYKVVQFGELDDEGVPIIFIEWTFFEVELNE